jgi:hypothetical protein
MDAKSRGVEMQDTRYKMQDVRYKGHGELGLYLWL